MADLPETPDAASESGGTASPSQVNMIRGVIGGSVIQARDIRELHLHLPERVPVPRQLPPAPAPFVNRHAEVSRLDDAANVGRGVGVPAVVILTGGHGVGKSATGRYWAHANTGRFADGQLYVDFGDLRHAGGVSVGDVLGGILRAMGLGDDVIPAALADREALFRSRLAGKRILILLDDARYAAEVTPLIPASADCCVLVTTRAPLHELLVDGARLVRLDPLDATTAELLLAEMIGVGRVAAEPKATSELSSMCGGLPVALRICGAQLAAHRGAKPIARLVARLTDEQRRLGQLRTGPGRSLQAVFDEAYAALDDRQARLYRVLGTQPGPAFTLALAAALLDGRDDAERLLEGLLEAQLIEDAGDRLRFHDLLRAHARQTARRVDSPQAQEETIAHTIDFYLHGAQRMDHAIVPDRLRFAPEPAVAMGEAAFEGPAAALAWFEAERANLVAAIRAAHERELHPEVWQLAEAMWIAYNNHKHYDEAREVYALGADAARRANDTQVEARMRQQLARAEIELEHFELAEEELDRATELAAGSGNARLEASILEFRGVLEIGRGGFTAAISPLVRARELFAANGYRRGVALQEYMLGRAYTGAGDIALAIEHLRRAEQLVDRESDVMTHGRVLLRLGQAQRAAGELESAARTLGATVDVMRDADALFYVASALEVLADVRGAQGAPDLQRRELQAALKVFDALGSPRAQIIRDRLDALGT